MVSKLGWNHKRHVRLLTHWQFIMFVEGLWSFFTIYNSEQLRGLGYTNIGHVTPILRYDTCAIVLLFHCFTFSLFHCFTVSPFHRFIVSPFHCFTVHTVFVHAEYSVEVVTWLSLVQFMDRHVWHSILKVSIWSIRGILCQSWSHFA